MEREHAPCRDACGGADTGSSAVVRNTIDAGMAHEDLKAYLGKALNRRQPRAAR
jgi:hypothetical protein